MSVVVFLAHLNVFSALYFPSRFFLLLRRISDCNLLLSVTLVMTDTCHLFCIFSNCTVSETSDTVCDLIPGEMNFQSFMANEIFRDTLTALTEENDGESMQE